MKKGNTIPIATANIIIGEIYKDKTGDRVFMALAKDNYSIYDCTGWMYPPQNLQKLI